MYEKGNPSQSPWIRDVSDTMILPKPIPAEFGNVRDPDSARNVENRYKNQAQLFLACLLAPFLAGRSRSCLVVGSVGLVGLMVETSSRRLVRMIKLTISLRCQTVDNDSQDGLVISRPSSVY